MPISRSLRTFMPSPLILVATLPQAPTMVLLFRSDQPVAAVAVCVSFASVVALLVVANNQLDRARAELATATQRLSDVTSQPTYATTAPVNNPFALERRKPPRRRRRVS